MTINSFDEQEIFCNIFAVPAGDRFGLPRKNLFLIYAPLAGESTLIDKDVLPELTAALHRKSSSPEMADCVKALTAGELPEQLPEGPEMYPGCIIIPTARCNFSCSYCFAAAGHSTNTLDSRSMLAALDFLLKTPRKKYKVLFSGGGEPLLEKELLKEALTYLKSRVGCDSFSVTVNTNGSLIDDEFSALCREFPVHPAVSFEVLEKLQKQTRGCYHQVMENIKRLIAENVIPSIISTLTPETAAYLPEMAGELLKNFPRIKYWTAELATLPQLQRAEMSGFHQTWMDSYFAARQIFTGGSRVMDCDFEKMMEYPRFRRCRGKMVITPSGDITICPLTTSPRDPLWDLERYGRITQEGEVAADREKFFRLIYDAPLSRKPCSSCFMKWNCAGGCHNQNNLFNASLREQYCLSAREFGLRYLLEKIGAAVKAGCGCSLERFMCQEFAKKRETSDE